MAAKKKRSPEYLEGYRDGISWALQSAGTVKPRKTKRAPYGSLKAAKAKAAKAAATRRKKAKSKA